MPASFAKEENISESIQFPGGLRLKYEILIDKVDQLECSYSQNKITISIPRSLADPWVKTDQVGFQREIDLDKALKLSILIEKDFYRRSGKKDENESDLYPNPLKSN